MKPAVYHIPVLPGDLETTVEEKVGRLFDAAGLIDCTQQGDLVGIKVHFGEEGNETFVKPSRLRVVIERLQQNKAKPFFTDTNTLYTGMRSNSVDHTRLAEKHGFGISDTGIPVIISDGLAGEDEVEVEIGCRHFNQVGVAAGIASTDSLMVITHVTGHCASGLGGTIKNLGMGCSSRKGKLQQHSALKPKIRSEKCTGDLRCAKKCPADAIIEVNDKAQIVEEKCIGCGECIVTCRFNAVTFNWDLSGPTLQERMAEHALGVVKQKRDRVGYISFMTTMTKECDCFGNKEKDVLVPAVGVAASRDPVALEQACVDIIEKATGRSFRDTFRCHEFSRMLGYAEEIGLGSRSYELRTVD